jgi:hypothetical protein
LPAALDAALPPVGGKAHAVRHEDGTCRMSQEPFVVLERGARPVVGGPLELSRLAAMLPKDLASGAVVLEDAQTAGGYPICHGSAPKVSYGKT